MELRERIHNIFLAWAEKWKVLFPNLERSIIQAEQDIDPYKLIARSLQKSVLRAVFLSAIVVGMGLYAGEQLIWLGGLVLLPVIFLFSVFTDVKGPAKAAKKRVRRLERDLPYALRHILIEVQSGIPLYNALISVTSGYGAISEEFQQIVRQISTGMPEVEALEQSVIRNPSLQYRRSLWQLISAIEAGANISTTLESLVESVMDSQMLDVRKYGRELNPYTLVYMLIGVIIPSMGVTFLMILSTFTGLNIGTMLFYIVLGGITLFQIFFISFVKMKRPMVKA